MKIALVYFTKKNVNKFEKIALGFKEGLAKLGHNMDIINGLKAEDVKLTGYKFVICGTEAISFYGGKISDNISRFFGSSGTLTGKNSFGFVIKSTLFGTERSLVRTMQTMEREGLFVTSGEIINSKERAEGIVKNIDFG
jgi:hypothetical protein